MKRIGEDGNAQKISTTGPVVKKTGAAGHWVNDEVKIIDSAAIFVPFNIIQIMNSLNDQFTGLEYSIFCKAEFDKVKKCFILGEEFFIPQQKVTAASVDYQEDAPGDEFNCVIHKHPRGCMGFSGTDNTYINQNFDLSLLWVNREFHIGQVRLNTPIGRIKLPLEIVVERAPGIGIPEELISKIKRNTYVTYKGAGTHKSSGLFKGGFIDDDDEDIVEDALNADSSLFSQADKDLLERMAEDEHF
ncbi:MAG: hypothetical protein KAS32_25620 [Candidatus Peribacteraceae bacterium]|nr:hypothetical protein [Candidatus Peribacteraceae bacterium]